MTAYRTNYAQDSKITSINFTSNEMYLLQTLLISKDFDIQSVDDQTILKSLIREKLKSFQGSVNKDALIRILTNSIMFEKR